MTKVTLSQEYLLEDKTYGPGEVEVEDHLAGYLERAESAHQSRLARQSTPVEAAAPARPRRSRAGEVEAAP